MHRIEADLRLTRLPFHQDGQVFLRLEQISIQIASQRGGFVQFFRCDEIHESIEDTVVETDDQLVDHRLDVSRRDGECRWSGENLYLK